ncbi:MAG: hypothetical protein AAFN77_10465 [Planctomycetota bacterium]
MLRNVQANFRSRRFRNVAIAAIAILMIALIVYLLNQSLHHSSFFTGYLLMGSFLLLTAFGMRKRLSFLPKIGSAQLWMQVHIYVGLATFAMFGLHVGWRFPDGIFETMLTVLFLIVGTSGLYGLMITRTYPQRLTSVGGEAIFERIPLLRAQIATRVRALVVESAGTTDVLGRFYVNHLAEFFEKPRGWVYWMVPNGRLKRQLVSDIGELDRYLAEDQRDIGKELCRFVEQRDRLDYHHALQSRLKVWLFVHIGFTYSLLLFSLFHMVLAHAFSGGVG